MQTLSEKLRLAATIVEANDNIYEYQAADGSGPWYKGAAFNISNIIAGGFNIRRIKHDWQLTRHIEGFRHLAEGEEWHRTDFTQDMLPRGWRPLLLGEAGPCSYLNNGKWIDYHYGTSTPATALHSRTTRPLPPRKKTVPFGPEDIFPTDSFRYREWAKECSFALICGVGPKTLCGWMNGNMIDVSYEVAFERMEINHSIALTGKWNPNAWESCSKEVEV